MTKLVRELMRPGVVTCKPQATLGQVANILTRTVSTRCLSSARMARSKELLPISTC